VASESPPEILAAAMPPAFLWLVLGCAQTSSVTEADPPEVEASEQEAMLEQEAEAGPSPLDGWAPVYQTDAGLVAMGEGNLLVGPGGVQEALPTGEVGPCGGRLLANQDRAVLVLPEGVQTTPPPAAPTVQAAQVELAGWRLNEVLPPLEESIENDGPTQPARQKGISVGSVSKTRRHGAPPIFLVSGVRGCTAALLILDSELENILDHHTWEGACSPLAVMPPADLDGDGQRELAVYNSLEVTLFRLRETPGTVSLQVEGRWGCLLGGSSP
jgi:hypothetical protein